MDPILVDAAAAAALLGIGETTVRELSTEDAPIEDRLPWVTVGRRKLYRPEGLRRWAEEREVYPALEEEPPHAATPRTRAVSASGRPMEAGRSDRSRKPRSPKAALPLRVVEG